MTSEPTQQDRVEARKVFLSTSSVFYFHSFGDGRKAFLCAPDGETPDPQYSAQHRGVEAAIVDLLLRYNPPADKCQVLTGAKLGHDIPETIMQSHLDAWAKEHDGNFSGCAEHWLTGMESDLEEEGDYGFAKHLWAAIKRLEAANPDLPNSEQYREKYPKAFGFLDAHRAEIDTIGESARALRKRPEFWGPDRIQISAEPALLENISKALGAGGRTKASTKTKPANS